MSFWIRRSRRVILGSPLLSSGVYVLPCKQEGQKWNLFLFFLFSSKTETDKQGSEALNNQNIIEQVMNYLVTATQSQRNLLLFCTDASLFFGIALKIRARLCFAHPNQYWIVGKDPSNTFHSFLWSVIQRETKWYYTSVKFSLVLQWLTVHCWGVAQWSP